MKLSEKELQDLNEIQQQSNNIIFSLGELVLQKQSLIDNYREIVVQQNNLGSQLSKKYGDGRIDLTTGEIQSPTEENKDNSTTP
jgi:uncharacterized protein (DUF3084 family)